ncbi:MAG: type II secretion system F family protein [Terracidiphilus sp.]|nr:type II secretion system F family protein [Terracidiphilus sp.]
MELAILAFCVMFLLIASGGLILFYREAMLKRITAVIAPHEKQKGVKNILQQTGHSLGIVVEQFERILPKSQAEVSIVQQRLIRAGYRKDSAVKLFYGAKVLVPLTLCASALVSGLGNSSPFIAYAASLGVGFLAPDFWLGKMISKRQARIRLGLPDVLDLLVICIEAGLGLDQAAARTAKELSRSQPAISDELGIVVLEQRAGRPRSDAWKHMAERTDVDTVRNLVTMLVQSEQFGTSIAKTLRTHSDTLRTQRVQTIEELAAKTTVKLIFPLVLFIFPCLFLVTVGPAVILMSESFDKFLIH